VAGKPVFRWSGKLILEVRFAAIESDCVMEKGSQNRSSSRTFNDAEHAVVLVNERLTDQNEIRRRLIFRGLPVHGVNFMLDKFSSHPLDESYCLYSGVLPDHLRLSVFAFEELWNLHPKQYHELMMHGRRVKTPRWQQAYGADYRYTGRVNKAFAVPPILDPLIQWSRAEINNRLNGILVNWYDGSRGHSIGRHRDSTQNLVVGSPIVMISFGEDRTFRVRPWKQSGIKNYPAQDGSIFVMPYETNLAWTHEVPASANYRGHRISVTIRAFDP
jgi:alkylated DNA repair dioxygenase AlkB